MTSIHKTYLNIQDKYSKKYGEKTILFMQVGSFHEAYATSTSGFDLFKLANIMNIVCTKKNKSIDEATEEYPYMLGFPSVAKTKYLNILIDHGFTVVIIDQVTAPPKPKREITGIYSPGTYIDSVTSESNNIVSFYIENEKQSSQKHLTCVGMSSVDLTTGKIFFNEAHSSIEDNNYAISESQRFINTFNPKETLFFLRKNDKSTNDKLIHDFELSSKICHFFDVENKNYKHYEKLTYQNEFFDKIYKKNDFLSCIEYLDLDKYNYARVSLIGLLDYAYQHDNTIINDIDVPKMFGDNDHLVLGNNAVIQLNVIDNNNLDIGSSSVKSLFDTVNNTSTSMGRRFMKDRLSNPLTSCSEITKYYENTETLINNNSYLHVEKFLKSMIDIERLHRKIQLVTIQPHEFCQFIKCYNEILNLISFLESKNILINIIPKKYECITLFYDNCLKLFNLNELSKQTINDMNRSVFNKGNHIDIDDLQNDIDTHYKFPDELCRILSNFIEDSKFVKNQIEKKTIKIKAANIITKQKNKNNSDNSDKEIYCDNDQDNESDADQEIYSKIRKKESKDGFSLVLTKLRTNQLLKNLKNTKFIEVLGKKINIEDIVFKTLKDTTKITLPHLDEKYKIISNLVDSLKELNKDYFIKYIIDTKNKYSEIFKHVNMFVSITDFLVSNAKTAICNKYTKPVIDKKEHSFIKCENIRHPIIEKIIDYDYVPHSIDIGNDINGMLIYGMNACGKCFGEETDILMFDGSIKKIKDIGTGDCVMGNDSTKRNVLSTVQGKDMLYNILIDNYRTIRVTKQHILPLYDSYNKKFIEITVEQYLNSNNKNDYKLYSVSVEFTNDTYIDIHTFTKNFDLSKNTNLDIIKTSSIDTRLLFIKKLLDKINFCYENENETYTLKFPLLTSKTNIDNIKHIIRSLGFIAFDKFPCMLIAKGNSFTLFEKNNINTFKFTISKNTVDFYYGFVVDNNHQFLLHNMIVSHNSSLMKSIGISIIMAQSGMFVPATKFIYSPYNSLYARITGNDNIFKGQSSFTVELIELNSILNKSNKNTLVIGDEPARGTENLSANALVASSVICLAKTNASFIFATHLHEIPKLKKIMELTNVKAFHLSVEYDREKDVLIFNRTLKEGSGDQIYGITVANKIIKNKEFIDNANELKKELFLTNNSIVTNKTSKYNNNLYITECSLCHKQYEYNDAFGCGNIDTHHIIHQSDFKHNTISNNKKHINKNQINNLTLLCKNCHLAIHNSDIEIDGIVKTSKGKQLKIKSKTKTIDK